MGIMVRERAHESALMEQRRVDESFCSERQLLPEPQLPSGWEKCLDLKSGLIYFKDWNSGTVTYRDPRRSVSVNTQRIGLLSISLSPKNATNLAPSNAGDMGATETTSNFMDEHSLELTLNLAGTSTSRPGSQEGSACTMEKVRSALERSQWLSRPQISLLQKRAESPSRDFSTSPGSRLHLESSSPSTSECSSECFTSPSVMSYQGDDEVEVQQPRGCIESCAKNQVLFGKQEHSKDQIMVTVGCTRCLMFVMLSKSHPSCPKCGNTDVLLELHAPLPKRQRITLESPSWIWSNA